MGYFRRRISRQRCAAQVAGAVQRYLRDPGSWQPVPARPPVPTRPRGTRRDSYLRFAVGRNCPTLKEQIGVFHASYDLRQSDELHPDDRDRLLDLRDWFNQNLIAPHVPERAIFWFRAEATECIGRIWEMVWILKSYDTPVWMMRSHSPGQIVYRDAFQVAALPPKPRGWRRRPV